MALANTNQSQRRDEQLRERKLSQVEDPPIQEPTNREITVIFQNQRYVLRTDGGDLDVRNKLTGHGFTITDSGDMIFISGPGGKDKPCGGRMMINTTGGTLEKHGGPIIQEAVASSTSPVDGDKAPSGPVSGTARSFVGYGNDNAEVHGDLRRTAQHVVIEATETLTLVGINGINLKAGATGGGTLTIEAGTIKQVCTNKEEFVLGRTETISSESADIKIDPRATTASISPGVESRKFLGDVKHTIVGCYELNVLGNKAKVPLIKNPKTAINISAVQGDVKIGAFDGSLLMVAGVTDADFGSIQSGTVAVSSVALDFTSSESVNIFGGADVTIESSANVNIQGALIYLN